MNLKGMVVDSKGTTVEEQATGCKGAHGYLIWAEKNGFPHVEILDWTSSAGDWSFIVSRDGNVWFILFQTNRFPLPGFEYNLSSEPYEGTVDEVLKSLAS